MNDARQAFSTTLRTHRERLGITLSDIADTTKINVALLTALERGDVSRWPGGIFRRAFFREYALAIGLSPEPLLNEFVRLFPDESAAVAAQEHPEEFRLALAVNHTPATLALKRLAVAVAELAGVAVVGVGSSWLVAVDMLPAIGFTALAYYPVTNLCVERTVAIRRLRALVKSPIPGTRRSETRSSETGSSETRSSETRRYEEIEGHEELQVSF